MHGRHGKKKSKRIKLGKKHKVEKKVREHHRKLKRDKKRHPEKYAKRKSDPGVPNSCPFKPKLIQEAQEGKNLVEERRLKMAKELKLRRKDAKEALFDKNRNIGDFMTDAEKRGKEFEATSALVETHEEFSDKSAKAYYKEFKKVVEASDVVLEVLDARDPQGSRCLPMEDLVKCNSKKRLVLVLNKADLVPRENLEAWLSYFRKLYPVVLFKASTQSQSLNLSQHKTKFGKITSKSLSSSKCVGADLLIQLLKNYSRNEDIKTSVVVGVVGMPNVGKSSLINSLKRSKACNVGSTPGITKTLQEICLDSKLRLLDCPGIILPGKGSGDAASSLRNAFKIEDLKDPITPVEAIIERTGKEMLMRKYKMKKFDSTGDFLANYAKFSGKLSKGGVPKMEDTARFFLREWNTGNISYYTLPPKEEISSTGTSTLISNLSEEFKIEDLMSSEKELMDCLPVINPSETVMVEGLQPIISENELLSNVVVDLPTVQEMETEVVPEKKERWETEVQEVDLNKTSLKKLQKKVSKKLRKEKSRNVKRTDELVDAFKTLESGNKVPVSDDYDFNEFLIKT